MHTPCLASKWAGEYSDAVDRAQARYEAAEESLNGMKDADLLYALWLLSEREPDLFPQGWDEMDSTEQMRAVQGNDLIWDALVESQERDGSRY